MSHSQVSTYLFQFAHYTFALLVINQLDEKMSMALSCVTNPLPRAIMLPSQSYAALLLSVTEESRGDTFCRGLISLMSTLLTLTCR